MSQSKLSYGGAQKIIDGPCQDLQGVDADSRSLTSFVYSPHQNHLIIAVILPTIYLGTIKVEPASPSKMLLFRPTLPFLTATSFLSSTFLLTHALAPPQSRHLLLDSVSSPFSRSDSLLSQYQQNAQTPVVHQRDGQNILNPRAVRQISTGSVVGIFSLPSSIPFF